MKINSLVLLERKTKSNGMIDLRIVCDRYVDLGEGRAGVGGSGPGVSLSSDASCGAHNYTRHLFPFNTS